jgi:hypothetical protein
MPNHVTNIIRFEGDEKQIHDLLEKIQDDELGIGSISFGKVILMPENIFRGNLGQAEREMYGSNNWYDWSVSHWGTKWDAYGFDDFPQNNGNSDTLRFLTAWDPPHPVLQKLSELAPDLQITHEWADEDIGRNCGRREYFRGELTDEYLPESEKEGIEFASAVMDRAPEDYGLVLNADESRYINAEADDYETVELFGKEALFTNSRLSPAEYPKGLYAYDLRSSDDQDRIASVEPHVKVNHAGTVLFHEPLDFKGQDHIALDENNDPNFLGYTTTFAQFLQGLSGPKEGMSLE